MQLVASWFQILPRGPSLWSYYEDAQDFPVSGVSCAFKGIIKVCFDVGRVTKSQLAFGIFFFYTRRYTLG